MLHLGKWAIKFHYYKFCINTEVFGLPTCDSQCLVQQMLVDEGYWFI